MQSNKSDQSNQTSNSNFTITTLENHSDIDISEINSNDSDLSLLVPLNSLNITENNSIESQGETLNNSPASSVSSGIATNSKELFIKNWIDQINK
jgi:hypothetical protein